MTYLCPGCKAPLKGPRSVAAHAQGHPECTLEMRFDGRCERLESGCIVYRGATDSWGYAHVGVRKKRVQAHRWSYERHKGPIPKGMQVCHSCDNPPCVNPEHLFLGTNYTNHIDKHLKNRDKRAIPPERIRELRKAFAADTGKGCVARIAKQFGIGPGVACQIRLGKKYGWVK